MTLIIADFANVPNVIFIVLGAFVFKALAV